MTEPPASPPPPAEDSAARLDPAPPTHTPPDADAPSAKAGTTPSGTSPAATVATFGDPANTGAGKSERQPTDSLAGTPGNDSGDAVEPEEATIEERLWATTLWLSTALILFLPPIPAIVAPWLVKRLRKRASEFVSWHAGNSLRFAAVATLFQLIYWVSAGMTAISLHGYWMLAFAPAVTLYTSFAVGMAAWLTLVGHNAWKGRRHRPSEFRNLVFFKR